jgi:hypothetical protein
MRAKMPGKSHFADCMQRTSRSTFKRGTAWRCAGMLRLVGTRTAAVPVKLSCLTRDFLE